MIIDHGKLDIAIGGLLERFKAGDVDKGTAVNEIAHVIQAVTQGNETEVLTFISSNEGARQSK